MGNVVWQFLKYHLIIQLLLQSLQQTKYSLAMRLRRTNFRGTMSYDPFASSDDEQPQQQYYQQQQEEGFVPQEVAQFTPQAPVVVCISSSVSDSARKFTLRP